MKKKLVCCFFVFFTINLFSQNFLRNVPDSSQIRKDLIHTWFEAPVDMVRENIPEIRVNKGGDKFKISMEEDNDYSYIFVATGKAMNVNVYSQEGFKKEQEFIYPGNLPGTFILIKDKKTNKPLYIRYFFTTDSDVYIQFSPYGRFAVADMVIFNQYVAKGVSIGLPFTTLYQTSLDKIYSLTSKSLPWNYVQNDAAYYGGVHTMLHVIQNNLSRIVMTDDAMYDENNTLIRITNEKPLELSDPKDNKLYLSSAGLVKWVCDGLINPVSGGLLKRAPLIVPTVNVKDTGLQGIVSQYNSLYFSLDWVRNLASAVISVYTGKKYVYPNSGVDVTINPFSSFVSGKSKTNNQIGYIKDTGYSAQVLNSLLYILGATQPDTIYLGAIRQTDFSKSPEVKFFSDCAVFFPYFDTNGHFVCQVLFNGHIMSLEDFCLVHNADFVYLTQVRSSQNFAPN